MVTYSDADQYQPIAKERQSLLHPNPDVALTASDLNETKTRKGDAFASAVVWISLTVFVVSTWAIILSNDPTSLGWFSYHPLLQSLAIACFTYGILTLQPTSTTNTMAAVLVLRRNALGLGAVLVLLGTLTMIANKNMHGAAHFTTWHGTLGIVSVAWIMVQAFVGGSTVWLSSALWGGAKPKWLWKYHMVSGYILYTLIMVTAYLGGGWSDWIVRHTNKCVRLMTYSVALCVILVGVYSRIRTFKAKSY